MTFDEEADFDLANDVDLESNIVKFREQIRLQKIESHFNRN